MGLNVEEFLTLRSPESYSHWAKLTATKKRLPVNSHINFADNYLLAWEVPIHSSYYLKFIVKYFDLDYQAMTTVIHTVEAVR